MGRLKDLRKERGYTQTQIQTEIGIDQSDYSKMERGERNLTFDHAKNLAMFFNVSMDYLAEITDSQEVYPRLEEEK